MAELQLPAGTARQAEPGSAPRGGRAGLCRAPPGGVAAGRLAVPVSREKSGKASVFPVLEGAGSWDVPASPVPRRDPVPLRQGEVRSDPMGSRELWSSSGRHPSN